MGDSSKKRPGTTSTSVRAAISRLRKSLAGGREWPVSLLETMAVWSTPQETYRGRTYNYFIAGEAFDWLLLAERLCNAIGDLVSPQEKEELLCYGRFPASFDSSRLRSLLGVDKHRGYLNYYYGVTRGGGATARDGGGGTQTLH